MNRYLFSLCILFITSGFVSGVPDEDPEQIMRQSINAGKFKGIETISTLKIIDAKGRERIRKIYMASKSHASEGVEKRIIKFLEPTDIKGTGMLVFDYDTKRDDMWMYLPALRKTRRIVSSEKSKSFMGSEFSNADMAASSPDDFNYELSGTEIVDGTPCWKIHATPVSGDVAREQGYASQVLFIGKKDFVVRRALYYDEDNDLYKVLNYSDIRLADPEGKKFIAATMIMENNQNGRSSIIRMETIMVNKELSDELFTLTYLERQ